LTANLPSVVTSPEGTHHYHQRAFYQSQASPQQSPRRYTAGSGKTELSAVLGRAIDLAEGQPLQRLSICSWLLNTKTQAVAQTGRTLIKHGVSSRSEWLSDGVGRQRKLPFMRNYSSLWIGTAHPQNPTGGYGATSGRNRTLLHNLTWQPRGAESSQRL